MSDKFTLAELNAISIIERIGSVFSILGCVFIIVTFLCSNAFHKPINRLVFYASFGNMLTNVGTLIAREYVEMPNSFGCQFQAFIIQMFMPADAFWTLAMAFNVYLTFYFKFDANRLRKMEIWYLLICYGVPFIPALTCIFVSAESIGRIYGNATLWCWVSEPWDTLRIATFYGPVWVVILATFFIYIRAGREIYRKRKMLRGFGGGSSYDPESTATDDATFIKTMEVTVTSEMADQSEQGIDLAPLGRATTISGTESRKPGAYSVTISSNAQGPHSGDLLPSADTRPKTSQGRRKTVKRRANYEASNAAWSYTKCSILFFSALLITWIPSSANRVYSVVHRDEASVPLEIMSAIVLPLQGFWNALIYIVTSWKAVKLFFGELAHRARPGSCPSSSRGLQSGDRNDKAGLRTRKMTINKTDLRHLESESMTELADRSRASSSEDSKV